MSLLLSLEGDTETGTQRDSSTLTDESVLFLGSICLDSPKDVPLVTLL